MAGKAAQGDFSERETPERNSRREEIDARGGIWKEGEEAWPVKENVVLLLEPAVDPARKLGRMPQTQRDMLASLWEARRIHGVSTSIAWECPRLPKEAVTWWITKTETDSIIESPTSE